MKEKTPSFPVLQTPRLVLSELDESHAETLHKIWTDPRVLEYLVLDPFTELEQTREMISLLQGLHASGEGIRWGLIRESDGNILGTCGFHKWDREHHRVEIGYELTSDAWRHGFMSEAVSAALRYGFAEMDCNRVEALVTVGNKASSGFLEKNGFTLEGTLRQYEWARGKFQDQWMFLDPQVEFSERLQNTDILFFKNSASKNIALQFKRAIPNTLHLEKGITGTKT